MQSTLKRLILAFEELDACALHCTWSWQTAAKTISLEIVLQIIHEQKNFSPWTLAFDISESHWWSELALD